jgi:hypothetical protein
VKDHSFDDGDLVEGQLCPWCHQEQVVYNGNFFCTNCEWVMGDGNRPKRIVRAYLVQRYLQAERAGDQAEMSRLAHYLIEIG